MITPEIEVEILTAFRKTRSPFKVARKVGVAIEDVFEVLDKQKVPTGAPRERNEGWGREEMRQYLVARHTSTVEQPLWDNRTPEVAEARALFEAGTHLLATGRDGGYRLLYSIPRKGPPRPQPGYFKLEIG